jgi:hypothetical protein
LSTSARDLCVHEYICVCRSVCVCVCVCVCIDVRIDVFVAAMGYSLLSLVRVHVPHCYVAAWSLLLADRGLFIA